MEELEATYAAADQGARGEGLMASELIEAAEPQTEPIATRQAYGDALVALGESYPEVVALDADLAVSTQSMKFGKQFPERFFNVGAAEANMMSMSCGLAATGKVPYASTFAIFATSRSYDQVRLGIAHNEPQGPDRRLARRRLARRGRRLAPDDRGHRPDAGDAEDAGGRAGRLQPGLHGGDRVLRAFEGPMYMRFGRPTTPFVYDEIPETLGHRRRRAPRGQGHLDLRLRPHGLARAGGGRDAGARGRGGGRGRQRLDHQADRLAERARARSPRPASR